MEYFFNIQVKSKRIKKRGSYKQMEKFNFRTIKLEDMMSYIEKNAPQDKQWFKSIAIEIRETKDGEEKEVYNHFNARQAFCERYMPEIIPVSKPKEPTKAELLAKW